MKRNSSKCFGPNHVLKRLGGLHFNLTHQSYLKILIYDFKLETLIQKNCFKIELFSNICIQSSSSKEDK